MFNVAHNTNYRHPATRGTACPGDTGSNRIFVWKILSHETFVNQSDWKGVDTVCGIEIASLKHRNSHSAEVVAGYCSRFELGLFARRQRRPTVDDKIVHEILGHRQFADHRSLNARYGIYGFQCVIAKLDLFW